MAKSTNQMNRISPNAETGAVGTTYYIHSTVLGNELGKVGKSN
jgi:hypothetical protein